MSMDSGNSRKRKHSDAVAASPLGMLVDAETARDFQLSDSGLSARGAPAGNIYSNITLGGETRAVLGNVFYTTNNNVTNPSERNAEEERHDKLMDTLAFDRMDFRRATIETAHTRTCQWIFEEKEFARWRDPAYRDTNHGFLWIKGKPGSGKSTMMKCILDHMTKHASECKIISFFFNARGERLERSTEGCYRSLIHQMLAAFPELRTTIQIPQSLSRGQASSVAMLQNIFHEAVLSLQQDHLVLMIDALDECDQQEIRSMVQSLGSLAQACELQGVTLSTCFASRHYPSITVRFCDSLSMEKSKGHEQDILMYARDSLAIRPDVQREEILNQVIRKAEGVFLWVVLVVRILNESFDKGQSHDQLLDALSNIPDDLDALLASIISNAASDQHTLPTLLWVLSERSPWPSDLIYAAIRLGAGETSHLQETRLFGRSFLYRFVLHASKGLVVVDDGPTIGGDDFDTCTLRFIHESVRQYTLTKGLAQLSPKFATNVEIARCVYMVGLYESCLRHFKCPLPTRHEPPIFQSNYKNTSDDWRKFYEYDRKHFDYRVSVPYGLPRHARSIFWHHLSIARARKSYDVDRIHSFPKSQYISITNHFCSNDPTTRPTASFLYLLLSSNASRPRSQTWEATHGLDAFDAFGDTVKDMLEHCAKCKSRIPDRCDPDGSPTTSCSEFLIGRDLDDYCGGRYGTPLIAALAGSRFRAASIAGLLLDYE
jgi:hypothetical protein